MSSEPGVSSAADSSAVEVPLAPRPVANRLAGAVLALVLGVLVLVAAAHESLYFAAWGPGGVPVSCTGEGVCSEAQSNAVAYAWAAVVVITVGAWLLVGAVRELGRRSDAAVGAVSRDVSWGSGSSTGA